MVERKKPVAQTEVMPRGHQRVEIGHAMMAAGLSRMAQAIQNPQSLTIEEAAALAKAGAEIEARAMAVADRPRIVHVTGRMTALTDDTWNSIIYSLEHGSTLAAAAAAAGVTQTTLTNWLGKGRRPEGKPANARFVAFLTDCTRAMGTAKNGALHMLYAAGIEGVGGMPPDWRATEAWLKRRHPREFGDVHADEPALDELREEARAGLIANGLPASDGDVDALLADTMRTYDEA